MDTLIPSVPTLLILQAVEEEPLHGYAIARWVDEQSQGILAMKEGTLYPVLHQLERKGLIVGEWRKLGRKTKVYRLTDAGRRHLRDARREWAVKAPAISRLVLGEG